MTAWEKVTKSSEVFTASNDFQSCSSGTSISWISMVKHINLSVNFQERKCLTVPSWVFLRYRNSSHDSILWTCGSSLWAAVPSCLSLNSRNSCQPCNTFRIWRLILMPPTESWQQQKLQSIDFLIIAVKTWRRLMSSCSIMSVVELQEQL